uniref:Uncharacterized protein n=1 Tax=Trichuris muris TaxID=70415 RepID=A0A5S6Q9H6_TRIMR
MLCFCLFCLVAPDGMVCSVERLQFVNCVAMSFRDFRGGDGDSPQKQDRSCDRIAAQDNPSRTHDSSCESIEDAAERAIQDRIERLLPKGYFFSTSEEEKLSDATLAAPDDSSCNGAYASVPFGMFLHLSDECRLSHIAEVVKSGDIAYLQVLRCDPMGVVSRLVCFGNGLEMDVRNLNVLSFLPIKQLMEELDFTETEVLRVFQPDELFRAVVRQIDLSRRGAMVSVDGKLSRSLFLGIVSASELPEFIRLFTEEDNNYEDFLEKSHGFLNPRSVDSLLEHFDATNYVNSFDAALRKRLEKYCTEDGVPFTRAARDEANAWHSYNDDDKKSKNDCSRRISRRQLSRINSLHNRPKRSRSSDKGRRRYSTVRTRRKRSDLSSSAHSESYSNRSLSHGNDSDTSSSRGRRRSSSSSSSSSTSTATSVRSSPPCTASVWKPEESISDLKLHIDQAVKRRGTASHDRFRYTRNRGNHAWLARSTQPNGMNRSSTVSQCRPAICARREGTDRTVNSSSTLSGGSRQPVDSKRTALAKQLSDMENFISSLKAKASSSG